MVNGQISSALLTDFSLGVTGKEIGGLDRSRAAIPPGTRVHVGFQDSEDTATRVKAARAVRRSGFVPVPIIAARRLLSEAALREYLDGLRAAGASESVLIVAGDPQQPRGPYPDAASVIGSGLLEEYGVRRVSVAGHPGGHPAVASGVLWPALATKAAVLEQRGLDGSVVTQFGFDAAQILAWLADLRARGLSLPVWAGVPGPASVQRLLGYASRCGVAVSPRVACEYGFSLTDLTRTAGPDRFIGALASGYDTRLHGDVKLHFNTFSGFTATVEWIRGFRGRCARAPEMSRQEGTQQR
jgi:methylenetetrahydrofolate reductase (NADPH)